MNYLYFAEGTINAAGHICMYPADRFLGFDPVSATTTRLSFKARNGTAVDDDVLLTHVSGKHKEVAELIASILEPNSVSTGPFIVVADERGGTYLDNGNGAGLTGVVEITTIA